MSKNFKGLISVISAVAIIVGSCLGVGNFVSAGADANADNTVEFGFNDGKSLQELGITAQQIAGWYANTGDGMTVAVKDNALNIHKASTNADKCVYQFLFPVSLKATSTYTLSYKYRLVSAENTAGNAITALATSYYNPAMWTTGTLTSTKPAGNYVSSSATGGYISLATDLKNFQEDGYTFLNKINYFSKDISYKTNSRNYNNDIKFTKGDTWNEHSVEFTADNLLIGDGYNYLALQMAFTENAVYEFQIDEIQITEHTASSDDNGDDSAEESVTESLYDFESGLSGITASVDVATSSVSIVDENSSNKVLSFKKETSNSDTQATAKIVLPYKLTVGKTYELTYSYKSNSAGTMQINQQSAWTTGYINEGNPNILPMKDSNGETSGEFTNIFAYFMYKPGENRLNSSGGFDWNKFKIRDNLWHTVSYKFLATEENVKDGYSNLALQVVLYWGKDAREICFDNISVKEMPSELKFVASDPSVSIESMYGNTGEELTLPDASQIGFTFLGWYTDSDYSQEHKYEDTTYIMGDSDAVLYAKYEQNTSAIVDFENPENPNYSFKDAATAQWMNPDRLIESQVVKTVGIDGTDTNALKLHAYNYHTTAIKLPIKLNVGQAYSVSFDYKTDAPERCTLMRASSLTALDNDCNYSADITDKTKNAVFARITGGLTVDYKRIEDNDWQHFDAEFIVSIDQTDNVYKYLGLVMSTIETYDEDQFLYVDNITVEKISSVSFITDNEEINIDPILGRSGEMRSFDCLSVAGYKIAGIYTDAAYSVPYTNETILIEAESKTLYVKYAKSDVYEFKFENSSELLVTTGNFGYVTAGNGVDSSNKALQLTASTDFSYAVFPYELVAGKEYVVTFKYRASSEAISPRLYFVTADPEATPVTIRNLKDLDGNDILIISNQFESRQFNVFGDDSVQAGDYVTISDPDWEWREVSYKFTAKDTAKEPYTYFALAGQMAFNTKESLWIDDLKICEYAAVVNYEVSYDGFTIDVSPDYAEIGEAVRLPDSVIEPFLLEGWYYDKDFKNKAEDTVVIEKSVTTLYGKVSKKNKVTIDFEDGDWLAFANSGWSGLGARIVDDTTTNQGNHVLRASVEKLCTRISRLNYQLLPNRKYKISVRYRTTQEHEHTNFALSVGTVLNNVNGYGVIENSNRESIFSAVTNATTSTEWVTASTTVATNEPKIDSLSKYLCVYAQPYLYEGMDLEIDDIVIEDIGAYDPTELNVMTAEDWPDPTVDWSIGKDGKNWITGVYVEAEDDTDFDNSETESDSTLEDTTETKNDNKTPRKKIKKVVKIITRKNYTPVIIGCVAGGVILVAAVIFFVIFYKKRKCKNIKA